jgi:hypothetical protein
VYSLHSPLSNSFHHSTCQLQTLVSLPCQARGNSPPSFPPLLFANRWLTTTTLTNLPLDRRILTDISISLNRHYCHSCCPFWQPGSQSPSLFSCTKNHPSIFAGPPPFFFYCLLVVSLSLPFFRWQVSLFLCATQFFFPLPLPAGLARAQVVRRPWRCFAWAAVTAAHLTVAAEQPRRRPPD